MYSGGGITLGATLFTLGLAAAGAAAWVWPNNAELVLVIGLVLGGIVLLVGELLLPTHGFLGICGLLCFGGVIGVCFYINRWFGLSVFAAAIVLSPLLAQVGLKIWERSPIGRRLILQNAETSPAPVPVRIGMSGTTVTELRPIGECDFGDQRLEVASELGIIRAGERVKIISLENGRPVVRRVEAPATV